MVAAFFLWLAAFFLVIAVLALLVYQLIVLAELESDFANPYESAPQINGVVLPEFVLQGVLGLLFLLSGNWLMFVFSVPGVYYNVKLYRWRQHLVDVTEICNLLYSEKRRRLFKLVYLVIFLALILLGMILSAMEDD